MLRQEIIKRNKNSNDYIDWRCHEVLRIEAFSDAVFAFSITLLIVSLEVPRTFSELTKVMQGFFAFAISFTLLFQIWYAQFKFFRRYGLQDFYVTVLNGVLLFVVLFYMYPLKFLFNLIIPGGEHEVPEGEKIITMDQVPMLMIIYGLGFISVYVIFILLYTHALKSQEELNLSEKEVFVTKTKLYSYVVLLVIGLCSVTFAYIVPPNVAGNAGWFYMLIGPALTIYFHKRKKIQKKKFD